jgi:alpha-L-fucosidase
MMKRVQFVPLAGLILSTSCVIAQTQKPASDPLAPTRDTKTAAEIDREWQQSVAKYDVARRQILADTEKQANDGPYRADWASLINYEQPQWYKDAKFGIFIHWGIYAVPAATDEWYPRNMYHTEDPAYADFQKRFASKDPAERDLRGYKDFIPLFRAEHFNATSWAKLFKDSGAQYVIPVAEHHDGFAMYDSQLSDWTAVKMGPKRDVIEDLSKAVLGAGLHFGVSFHRAEHNFFFDGGRSIRSDVNDPKNASLYGPAHYWMQTGDARELKNDWTYVSQAWTDDWLARASEIVEHYKPEVVYFDWWVGHPTFRRSVTQFAAFYYNHAATHGYSGVIDIKDYALNWKTGARDFERGAQDQILAEHWQTDTSISNASWGYVEHDTYKSPAVLIDQLADIVSKNGNLLLNIGPRADGTIPEEVQNTLHEIGGWLKVNGEAIYGTTCWKIFGEGPARVKSGDFQDSGITYTTQDFRFTAKGDALYAIGLACPTDGRIKIQSLGLNAEISRIKVADVLLLGSANKPTWQQDGEGLKVNMPKEASCKYAYVLKIAAVK